MASTLHSVRNDAGTIGLDGPPPEHELVAGLHAGRREAFERLYELYRARIFNLALRIVQSHEDARDITQEVFIKAYRLLPGRDADLQLKPWLYRVAVNACYDHLRTRKMHSDIDEARQETRAVHIDTYEQAELGHQLEQTLARLSERHRTVLLLKDVHGLHHDEIASILGVSRGATETLLFRARAAFRDQYATLTPELPVGRCDLARRAAVAAVGGELPAGERRKIMVHAQTCPDCRETVKTWGIAAVGLGLFLHSAALPAALQAPFSGAAAAGAGAGGAASAAGATGTGAAGAGGGSGVTAAAAGGLVTKVGALVATKIALVAVAATVATAGAGVAAYEVHAALAPGASGPNAALAQGGSGHAPAVWAGIPLAARSHAAARGGAGSAKGAKSGAHNSKATGGAQGKAGAGKANSHAQGKTKGNGNGNGHAQSKAKGNGNAAGHRKSPATKAKPSKAKGAAGGAAGGAGKAAHGT